MTQPRFFNQRNIKLRRLFQLNRSLGIVIPSTFADKIGLKSGEYVKCELSEEGTSFTVEKAEWSG